MPALLSPDALARALAVADLTDPANGPHAIQLVADAAIVALRDRWRVPVHVHRSHPVVPIEDNYDRLGYAPGAVARDARYTRYVSETCVLRSHTSAMVPAALRGDVLVHEETGTNLAAIHEIHIGNAAAAFEKADYTRREIFRVHRHTGNPMETRGLVASFEAGKRELTVYGMTKLLHYNRQVVAAFLKLPEHHLHFIENDVGGGFGIRGELYPEDFLIPFASMRLGTPVKWIEDRREHLMAANHSREVSCDLEIAARRDGTLLALRAKIYGNMGAYVRTHGGLVPCSTAALLPGPYRIPNYECKIHCVVTNKTGMGTYRAPGRYESCFFRERMLDMVAADLNLDPVELRRKNLIQPEEIPYEIGITRPGANPTVLDSANFPSALNRALEEFAYQDLKSLQGRLENGRYHGIGLSYFVKNTGGLEPYEGARVVLGDGPSVAVYLSINVLGQGHETAMAQICSDGLGVPREWASVFHGNPDLGPFDLVIHDRHVYGAAPPGVRDVSLVCGSCHAREAELFNASRVKDAMELQGKRACVTCHNNHDVQHPTDAMLSPGPDGLCGQCHQPGKLGRQRLAQPDGRLGGMVAALDVEAIKTARNGVHQAHRQEESSQDSMNRGQRLVHGPTPVYLDTSPPARVPRARQVARSIVLEIDRTEPSISSALTTPAW